MSIQLFPTMPLMATRPFRNVPANSFHKRRSWSCILLLRARRGFAATGISRILKREAFHKTVINWPDFNQLATKHTLSFASRTNPCGACIEGLLIELLA
jgi:hypothetical protein